MQRTLQYINSYEDPENPGQFITIQNPYANIARDLARLNSKNEEVTSRDGHVFGYLCRIKIKTAASGSVSALMAPNSWKMRNSFRKFHAYRNTMFDNIGAEGEELGRYGKTIRPLLDKSHSGKVTDTMNPFTTDSSGTAYVFEGGEWSYTQLAVTPTYQEGAQIVAEQEWADAFSLHICEENLVAGNTATASGYYKSVGMIHSYNIDRQEVQVQTVDTVIDGPSNPLAQLISSGNQAAGEVLDILEEQELEAPPYDLDDDGDSIYCVTDNIAVTPTTGGTVSFMSFVPAGLMQFRFTSVVEPSIIEIEVLDKVLCKDM